MPSNTYITEGIAGVYCYHLSKQGEKAHALCGARIMPTMLQNSTWGHVGHLNESYCSKCVEMEKGAPDAE